MPPPPERFHEIVIPQNMVKPVMGRPEPPRSSAFPRTQPAYVPTVEEVMLDELEQAAPAPESPRIIEAYDPSRWRPDVGARFEPMEIEPVVRPSLQGASRWSCCPALTIFSWSRKKSAQITIDEVIPRPAPMHQRLVSGVVDVAIVFHRHRGICFTFMEVAEETPQSRMTMVCMLAAGGIFWLLFQYIFPRLPARHTGNELRTA